MTYHGDFFVFPRNIQDAYNVFYKYPLYCQVININPENASSRKLGNQNWFSQPLVHTVMGRTRALRALVLAHNCMNSWLGKPSSGFSTSGKRYNYKHLRNPPTRYFSYVIKAWPLMKDKNYFTYLYT